MLDETIVEIFSDVKYKHCLLCIISHAFYCQYVSISMHITSYTYSDSTSSEHPNLDSQASQISVS